MEKQRKTVPGRFLGVLLLTLGAMLPMSLFASYLSTVQAAAPFRPPINVPASTSLVISQVYGGGGNTGAPYTNDFVELFNPTASSVTFSSWSIQYASGSGNTWNSVTPITGTIPAGGYFLIQEGSGGANGVSLPPPDAIGNTNMGVNSGKLALVNTTTHLSGVCPWPGATIVDFVGYGTTTCAETSAVPALDATTSAQRKGAGCVDTDNNLADFTVAAPAPRNSVSALNPCSGGSTATPTVTGTPPTSTSTPILTSTSTPTNTPSATNTGTPPTSTPTVTPTNTSVSVSTDIYLYMVHYTSYLGQTDEGVRLVNTASAPSSVGGWSVVDSSGSVTLPMTATIPANSSIWIANSATGFSSLFGFSPDYEYGADSDPSVPQAVATSGFTFPDAGDAVQLLDSSSQTADTLVYKNGNIATAGWSGASLKPYLPAGQPNFTEAGQIFYRKLDEATGRIVTDTNTKDDWAQDDDPAGTATPIPGDRSNDDISGKKLLRPGWALTNPAYEDMFFTKQYTDTNVTTKFLVDPDNSYDSIRNLLLGATQSITIETYEWHNAIWVQDIIDAHARGVNVGIILDGNPCCANTPDNETLWSAKQWEDAGIPVYFFSGTPNTSDSNYRYNNVHAKILMVDNQWVLTGSDNFTIGGMTNDPRGNGTGGNRGAMIITNAPDVVSYTARLIAFDFQPGKYADVVRYPALGTPPPGFSPTPFPDIVSAYTPVKATPLVVTETESIEIIQSPDNALRDEDSLIGLVNQAGVGDEVMVEQQYERKYWETSPTNGPNPRLAAYIRAAQRGANVRIILDGYFEGGDCTSSTHNPATVAYVNGFGLPNLHAEVAVPSGLPPDGSGNAGPGAGNIHNKMALVTTNAGTKGYLHITSINGSLNSAKNNREYGLQIQSNAGYQYYKDVFDHDWSVGYLPCGSTPTPTAGTPSPTPSCNALVNGDFETGDIAPWATTTAVVTAVADNEVSHSGDYSIAITHNLVSNSQGVQENIPITIQGGSQYRLQGWVLRPDPNINSARVRVAWYACPDFACSQISTNDVFAGNTGVEGWQFFSGTVTAPANAVVARYRLYFTNASAIYTTIHFDDVLFECQPLPSATPTDTPTATNTAPPMTDTPTSTATDTVTTTPTDTATSIPTSTATDTAADTPTSTPTDTPTSTPTDTATGTPTSTATDTTTDTPTSTNTVTNTPTNTNAATNTPTNTPISTATATNSPTGTNTATNTATRTNTATDTATSTNTPTNTNTATNTPTDTPTNSPTSTPTNSPSNTPTNTGTPANTPTGTRTPTNTATNTSTSTNTATSTNTPTGTPTHTPTNTNTATNTTTPVFTNTPTNTPVDTSISTSTSIPTSTATVCVVPFTDVHTSDWFYDYVQWMYCNNVIHGYDTNPPCFTGTPCFKPENPTTRGQMAKIVALAFAFTIDITGGPHFQDVAVGSTYYDYAETAMHLGLVSGYPCGGPGEPCIGTGNLPYYRPNANVTRGQIARIAVSAAIIADPAHWTLENPPTNTFEDVAVGSTFFQFVETAASHGILSGYPCGSPPAGACQPGNKPYFLPSANATRAQISKVVYLAATYPPVR